MIQNATTRLLQGVKIITLSINTPGPVAASRLAHMGAQVTKIEPPGGDPLKAFAPAWYFQLCQEQRVLAIDLKEPAGLTQLDELLGDTDLLLASFRPSALRRLRLDWETLHARHPRLCFAGITGYPWPDEERSGHDLTYLAGTGLLSPPELPGSLFVDLAGAERCLSQSLALLLHRERTGEAECATISLYECAVELAAPAEAGLTSRGGMLRGTFPLYGLYEASDGWIAVAALEPQFASRLLTELKLTQADRDLLTQVFRQRKAQDWEAWAAERDLPLAAVRRI
ncbi:MAG: CoA transferase [Candidatus Angelobacter sp.]